MKLYWIAIAATLMLAAGCQVPTRDVDTMHDDAGAVMGLDYRDFDRAATAMIESLMRSGALEKPDGQRYVVATGRILNDTTQRIDTDQLMAKIEREMMNSGQVVMTSAVGGRGATDVMIDQMRQIRESEAAEEFQDDTLPATRQLIAPELSIGGKIFQRTLRLDRRTDQVEYYFQLQLTDITSGLRFWQDEKLIAKRGDRRAVSW